MYRDTGFQVQATAHAHQLLVLFLGLQLERLYSVVNRP